MLKYVLVLVILVLQCVNGPQEPDYSFNISVESAKVTGINDTMIFTAQSDLPGTVRYVWMLDNNPVCDTTDTNIFTTSWKMQDTGIHTISVSAFSGHHKFALPVTKEFLVTYARPQVALKLDTRVSVNDTVVIHALASDSDGVIKSYSWSVDPDGVFWSEHGSDSLIWKWNVSDTGTHTVRVKVVDDDGLTGIDSAFIYVALNPPVINLIPHDTTVYSNDTVTILANASDSNGVIIRYEWTVDGDKLTQNSEYLSLGFGRRDTGEHKIVVTVTDDDGIIARSDTAVINVRVDLKPPTVVVVPADTSIFINDSVIVVANAVDSDGTIEKYEWDVDGYILQQNTERVILRWGINDTGTHLVSVSVTDDDGTRVKSEVAKIRVLAGFPAVIIKQIPVISSRDTVVVTCDAFDTNGTVKKYFWYREGYKLIDSTLEPEIAVRYYGRSPQKIICKVVDDDGLINHDSALIHFNRPPESTVKSPADTVSVGESEFPYPVKFIVSCSDPDSDTVKIKLHTGVDFDSMNIVYQGTDSIIPYNLTQPGETCWKLEVTDSWGNTVSHSGKFTTVLTHTICFVGHSIVEGMLSDHNHGGFRKGVIDGLRDSLPLHERLKSVGPLITPEMQSYPADDSCLAISGTTAKEIYLLLTRVSPQLKSDIWVLLLGVNDWYSTGEKNYIVKIIDIMLARNPASRVYVLNSVPVSEEHVYSGSINYNLPDFNKALEDSINVRRVGGKSVYLVNMFTLLTKDNAFDPTWFSDPLHPNQDGYDRIADEILRIMYQDSSRALRKPEEK